MREYAKSDENGRVSTPATMEVFEDWGLLNRSTKKELGVKAPGNNQNVETGQGVESRKKSRIERKEVWRRPPYVDPSCMTLSAPFTRCFIAWK